MPKSTEKGKTILWPPFGFREQRLKQNVKKMPDLQIIISYFAILMLLYGLEKVSPFRAIFLSVKRLLNGQRKIFFTHKIFFIWKNICAFFDTFSRSLGFVVSSQWIIEKTWFYNFSHPPPLDLKPVLTVPIIIFFLLFMPKI